MEDCKCEDKELRKLITTMGTIQYKMQCVTCGATGNAIAAAKLTDEQKQNAPPVDRDLRETYQRYRSQMYQESQIEKQRCIHPYKGCIPVYVGVVEVEK